MSSNVIGPSFYADFNGLDGLKKSAKANDPNAIRQAARQFESLFTNMLLKTMREAKLGDGMGDSQETDFYQGMFDQQLAVQMSQGKGIGLAEMLVQQLTRRGLAGATNAASGASATTGAVNATTTAAGPVTDAERSRFIHALEPAAEQAAAQLGVSSDTVIAQAALETGWGRHVPDAADGTSGFNLFGIKAGAGWRGQQLTAMTTEYRQGDVASLPQAFRRYDSTTQSVNDYVTLLKGSSRYQQALGTGSDTAAFASALVQGGYATDPDYARNLVATAASVRALRANQVADSLKSAAILPTTMGGTPA